MASLKDLAESRGALLNFDPRKIQIKPGLNARLMDTPENREHVEFLKASIRENGFYSNSPLEIFQDGGAVFLSDGHCRLTAVMALIGEGVEILTVPCVPEGRGVNDVDRILRQNVSNSGRRLTPLEEGHNVKRALGFGLSVAEVARRIGRSETQVARMLDLQAAPAEVQQLVREGKVSASFAADVAKAEPENAFAKLNAAVVKAATEGRTKATPRDAAKPRKVDPLHAETLECLRLLFDLSEGHLEGRSDANDALLARVRAAIASAEGTSRHG